MAQLAMLGGGGGGIMSLMLPMFSSVIGMFMQPGQKEEQGKLNDLKVSTSAYGQGIAIVYGTMRVPGNMFWATEFEEEKRYINSKGKDVTGKKKAEKKGQPVYEYYANFAMGLCEGPVGELLRVWADSNLIYDKLNPDNPDIVTIGFSQGEASSGKFGKGGGTGKKGGSQESGRFRFRFYNGSESQTADPHMAAKNSYAGNQTPGHRGLCYLYFEHFALMDFGNRTPTITAEVTKEHQRKPIFTTYVPLEKRGIESEYPQMTGFKKMFFDPVRLKIYTLSSDTDEGILRMWDVDKRIEEKRIRVSDIKGKKVAQIKHPAYGVASDWYRGYTTIWNGWPDGVNYATSMVDMEAGNIIGVMASGDLVARINLFNSNPIVFIDPITMKIKNRFGIFDSALSNGTSNIQIAMMSTILSYFDPLTKTPYYYTCIVSQFGGMYFFDDKNEPMNYWTGINATVFGGSQWDYIAPGLPSMSGSTFYAMNGDTIFGEKGVNLYRFEAPQGLGTQYMQKTIGKATSGMAAQPQKQLLIYESLPEEGEVWRTSTTVYPIVGAEAVCFLEMVQGAPGNSDKNGVYAVKVDYAVNSSGEFEVLWRHKISSSPWDPKVMNGFVDSVVLTGHRLIIRRDDTTVWEINFTEEKMDIWFLPEDCPPSSYTQFYFPVKGCIYQEYALAPMSVTGIPSGSGSTIVEIELDRMVQQRVTVEEILRDLADRVGIGQERINSTMLNDDEIMGYVVQQPKAARRVADDLMKVFFFDMAESDYVLKAVSRSQSVPVVTVSQQDLGFIDGGTPGDNASDYYKETRVQEIDLPQTTMITYIDPKDDYESGEQHWRRPRSPMAVMQSREKLDINLPMALEADFAKQTAMKITYSAWAERSQYEFALPWKFLRYDPTDVMIYQMDDGLTFQSRMSSMDLGQDFSIRATGVATEMASYSSDVRSQGNGVVVPVPHYVPPFTRGAVFDIPYFEDVDSEGDNGFMYHWGLKAYGPGFRVGTLSKKVLPKGVWEGMGMTPFDIPWGTVLGMVPPPPWGSAFPTDDVNRIRLMPAFDFLQNPGMYEWESIPDEQWPSHANTIVINNEIIYFKDFEMMGDGTIEIYNLIRGARGTINAAYSHYTGEDFHLVTASFQSDIESFEDVGSTFAFRPASPSIFMGALPTFEEKLEGASHKPWAPGQVKRSVASGNITFTWERSARLSGQLKDGTGTVPNVDGPIEYEVYILNAPYDPDVFDADVPATYKRKFGPLTANTVTYTAANLASDGLTTNSTVHVAILQRNQFVGRGFPGWYTSFPGV